MVIVDITGTSDDNLLNAFNGTKLDTKYVQVEFRVICKQDYPKIIENQAQISDDTDETGKPVTDRDSTPNKWQDEDDEDIEKVRIPIFDLSLLKWVTQSVVTVDGKTTTTNTGFKPNKGLTESTGEGIRNNNEPEPIAKVELDKKKLNKTVVKFVYKIRVTN